jgi:hypothetical protein
MTTSTAARWFYTQPSASLNNALSRAALAELLNDPVNALAILRLRSPLRMANPGQYAALSNVTSAYLEILARLPINWYNALEINNLNNLVLVGSVLGLIEDAAPLLWYRFDETATPAVNYGSVPNANGAVANATFQQAGPNDRIPYSYGYNGATTALTIPSVSGLPTTDRTIAILVNPATAGEGSTGVFAELTTGGNQATLFYLPGVLTSVNFRYRNTADSAFNATTTTGLTAGQWVWLFGQYSDASKQGRVWKGLNGALSEFAYSAQQSLTGTARGVQAGTVGNVVGGTNTTDGKIAQFMLFNTLLTTTQMQNIVTASGV